MPLRPYLQQSPTVAATAYIDPAAVVIGDVVIGDDSSLWPMAVARGDVNPIRIGARSNIQDGSVLHVTHARGADSPGYPLLIGDEVTVGHNVTLHGCSVGARCLIGMASTVLDGATLEPYVLLGAGSLVPPGKRLEGGYLWLGNPVRRVRPLTLPEREQFEYSALHYVRLKDRYLAG